MGCYDTIRVAPKLNAIIQKGMFDNTEPCDGDYQSHDLGKQLFMYEINEDLTLGERKIPEVAFDIYSATGKEMFGLVENGKLRYVAYGIADCSSNYSKAAVIMEFHDNAEDHEIILPNELRFVRIANEIMTELGAYL